MNSLIAALAVAASAAGGPKHEHPAFLHALSDLRAARAYIKKKETEKISDALRKANDAALASVEKTLAEIKQASIDDGKNIDDLPKKDAKLSSGPDHRARELCWSARKDIEKRETDPKVADLRKQVLADLDQAVKHLDETIKIAK